jgi:hypothetical protein
MNQEHGQNSIRRIVLPSGRSIEIVRLHDSEETTRRPLHICPVCSSDLVQPMEWSEPSDEHWELALYCPNCQWTEEGAFSHEQIHELEDRLDQALESMLRDLQRITEANTAEEIDRFVAALEADLILPEDF